MVRKGRDIYHISPCDLLVFITYGNTTVSQEEIVNLFEILVRMGRYLLSRLKRGFEDGRNGSGNT
jgi:hypothetical protein